MRVNYLMGKIDEETRKAIWQYIIDHSKVQKNGYLGVQLYIMDEEDLWKRVQARRDGEFRRYREEEKKIKQQNNIKYYEYYLYNKRRSDKINKKVQRILKNGSVIEKILYFAYRFSRDRLFPRN